MINLNVYIRNLYIYTINLKIITALIHKIVVFVLNQALYFNWSVHFSAPWFGLHVKIHLTVTVCCNCWLVRSIWLMIIMQNQYPHGLINKRFAFRHHVKLLSKRALNVCLATNMVNFPVYVASYVGVMIMSDEKVHSYIT